MDLEGDVHVHLGAAGVGEGVPLAGHRCGERKVGRGTLAHSVGTGRAAHRSVCLRQRVGRDSGVQWRHSFLRRADVKTKNKDSRRVLYKCPCKCDSGTCLKTSHSHLPVLRK